jgi:CRP/FNR family transcriptional regulator, cyclic AMP receptor protein
MPVTVPFDPASFLEAVASGRFTQGEPAVFYIRSGKIKLTVVSKHGKESIVAILGKDEFLEKAA